MTTRLTHLAINADDADAAREAHRLHEVVERQVRLLLTARLVSLVADALAPAVRAEAVGLLEHLLDR